MTEPLAQVRIEDAGQHRLRATVIGEIDLSNAEQVERQLNDAAQEADELVVDLTGVQYMDSQGVRILQSLADRHALGGVRVTIVAATESIAGDILALTRIGDTVEIVEPPPPSGV
jgi:anti-anti-sigma factor